VREGHRADLVSVALERLPQRARGGVPDPDCVIPRGRRQQL